MRHVYETKFWKLEYYIFSVWKYDTLFFVCFIQMFMFVVISVITILSGFSHFVELYCIICVFECVLQGHDPVIKKKWIISKSSCMSNLSFFNTVCVERKIKASIPYKILFIIYHRREHNLNLLLWNVYYVFSLKP